MKNLKVIKKIVISVLIINCILISPIVKSKNIDITVSAPTFLLVENNTGQILYEKDAHKKVYPASITKLMTAIIAVEQCNLDDIATVSYNALYTVPSGYVTANLRVGEELTIEELLNLALIPSANDAANVLAEHISGSIESFATVMNTKAIELGCENTHFTNPSGIHNKDHYTTAYDLYLIAKYAMQKQEIRDIVTKQSYTLRNTNKYESATRKFTTSNYMIDDNKSKYFYEYAIGGKTGYTEEAGDCVIEFAKKDDMELVAVMLGEKYDIKNRIKFINCKEIFDEVFENYKIMNIATKGNVYNNVDYKNREIELTYGEDLFVVANKNNDENFEKNEKINIEDIDKKDKDSKVGEVIYTIDGEDYTVSINANNIIIKNNYIFGIIVLIFIIFLIINIRKIKKKKNKKKKNKR